MRYLALLIFTCCGAPQGAYPTANEPCDCTTRGDYVLHDINPARVALVCTRIASQHADGAIDFTPCDGIECCRWRAP